jgi:hypothetical protein
MFFLRPPNSKIEMDIPLIGYYPLAEQPSPMYSSRRVWMTSLAVWTPRWMPCSGSSRPLAVNSPSRMSARRPPVSAEKTSVPTDAYSLGSSRATRISFRLRNHGMKGGS